KRGTGRAISKAQAIDILRKAGQAGLVQMVENSRALGKVICNCCSCCCAIIRPARTDPACKPVLAPSLFKASLVEDNCIGDELCLDVCPMDAIELDEVTQKVRIDEDRCLGCGACLSACLSDALNLVKIRQPDFIPE
ncbi:MAG: 4Fe-4S dicluster domain-containing protein, partial [Deltaproteobacteria bacterium]|nr:4Fe-4S dicluster domain-containing protein [Deltaproteobacteria bacterium]